MRWIKFFYLLEFAAIQTLLNGGTVYAVEPEKMPDTKSLAAVFRYSFSTTPRIPWEQYNHSSFNRILKV
jgi:hypothetical protein